MCASFELSCPVGWSKVPDPQVNLVPSGEWSEETSSASGNGRSHALGSACSQWPPLGTLPFLTTTRLPHWQGEHNQSLERSRNTHSPSLLCKILPGIDIAPNLCVDFVKPFKFKIPRLLWLFTKALNHKRMHFCKSEEFSQAYVCRSLNKTKRKRQT